MFKWVSISGEKNAIMEECVYLLTPTMQRFSATHGRSGILAVQQPTQQFRCYSNLIPDS